MTKRFFLHATLVGQCCTFGPLSHARILLTYISRAHSARNLQNVPTIWTKLCATVLPFSILLGTPKPLMQVVADVVYVLKALYGVITAYLFLLIQTFW